jgi:hypothetical protein
LISNLTFENNLNKNCMDVIAQNKGWKYIDEVTEFGCSYSGYEATVAELSSLTRLYIGSLKSATASLDVSLFDNLTSLTINGQASSAAQNDSITLSQHANLKDVTLKHLGGGSIVVSNNPKLKTITLDNVRSSTIDLSRNTQLNYISLFANPELTSLNVSNNSALDTFLVRDASSLSGLILRVTPHWVD